MDTKTTKSRSGRVTIREVAEDASVSVAAVSKVMRDAYGVSDALRARVLASIAKLNYRPSAAARAMRGQTFTIGVLMADMRNPFYPDILDGVNAAFAPTPYQTLIGIGRASSSVESALVHAMVDRQMDGIIMIGQRMSSEEVHEIALTVPTVVIGHHEPEASTFDSVNNDDRLGGKLVVQHLLAQGYRRPVMLSLDLQHLAPVDVSLQRELGFADAMREAGLGEAISIVRAPHVPGVITETMRQMIGALMSGRNPPDAIFGWADYFAFEIITVLRDMGIRVPEDVAVIGYDNSAPCTFMRTDMSSVDQSGTQLGLEASRLLLERIDGRQAAVHHVIVPRIIGRSSTRTVTEPKT